MSNGRSTGLVIEESPGRELSPLLSADGYADVPATNVLAPIPFGALGISARVGILFPFHPMPLRFRWEHRRRKGACSG